MEFVEQVKEKEFEEFVSHHPTKSHFMQSYYWGDVSKEKGFVPHRVGLKSNQTLVATALILEKHLFGKYTYLYIPRGFVTDFSNHEIVQKFLQELKKFGKKRGAIFIAMDPDIKLQNLDPDGNVIHPEKNNFELVNFLKKCGLKHLGFNKNFENREPRYTFRLNLDQPSFDDIYKGMHPTTRKILNKGNQYNLDVFIGDESNIDDFYLTMKETAIREHLFCFSKEYYLNFYHTLHQHKMSDLYVVKVDISKLKETYQKKIQSLKEELESLDESKYKNKQKLENKKKDLQKNLEKVEKEYNNIEQIDEKELVLSSIMTAKYHDKVWTIHGGNHRLLRELNANYLLYYTIIKDAYDQGYKTIDFFGTIGDPNPKDNGYGIHLFKKRLGGEYTEFIGEFHLILNKPLYFLYQKVYPRIRKMIKKRKG